MEVRQRLEFGLCWWTKNKEKRKFGSEAAPHPPKIRGEKEMREREKEREEREAPD